MEALEKTFRENDSLVSRNFLVSIRPYFHPFYRLIINQEK